MKKNLYFKHSDGRYTLLLEDCYELEAWDKACEFMKEHNFTYYYVRSWTNDAGNLTWDVGSWSEFFIWGFVDING